MYYVRHYYYSGSPDPHFKDFLEREFNIPCIKKPISVNNMRFTYIFDVPENHPRFKELAPYLPIPSEKNQKASFNVDTEYTNIIYFPQYSEQEYNDAKWLSVRSCFGKVYPENVSEVTRRTCLASRNGSGHDSGRHEFFNGHYLIKNDIKWGRHFFASAAYVSEYEMFCNQKARDMIESSGLNGVEYEIVRRKSTGEPLLDIYRLSISNIFPNDAIVPVADMDRYTCEQCGMHMLGYQNTRGIYGIRSDSIDNNLDFYITLPLFTPNVAASSINGHSKLIVSQRFYRLVLENKMDRSLMFEPVCIV